MEKVKQEREKSESELNDDLKDTQEAVSCHASLTLLFILFVKSMLLQI